MNAAHGQDQLTLNIGSCASEMADAVVAVQSFLHARERGNEYNLMLVFRELVGNAIVHGNRGDKERSAEIILNRLGEGRFQLRVRDEGEGFNHKALDLALPGDTSKTEGRGLPLVSSLVDELRFNNKGNEATALLTLPRKAIIHKENDGEWRIVRPDKDIVGQAVAAGPGPETRGQVRPGLPLGPGRDRAVCAPAEYGPDGHGHPCPAGRQRRTRG